jgi:hypothetical protein
MDNFIFYIFVKIHILCKEKFCFYFGETTFSDKMSSGTKDINGSESLSQETAVSRPRIEWLRQCAAGCSQAGYADQLEKLQGKAVPVTSRRGP